MGSGITDLAGASLVMEITLTSDSAAVAVVVVVVVSGIGTSLDSLGGLRPFFFLFFFLVDVLIGGFEVVFTRSTLVFLLFR